MKLSKQSANAMSPGEVLKDHVVAGLELHAGATGKSWKLYYRDASGKQRRPKLGDYPALTLETARDVAREWRRRIASGENPSVDRRAARAEPTIAEVFVEYAEKKLPALKRDSRVNCEKVFRLYVLPKFGATKISALERRDVIAYLDRIANREVRPSTARRRFSRFGGPALANHTLTYLSSLYAFAASPAVGLVAEDANPCRGVSKYPERKRRRHMTSSEFPAVFRELRKQAEKTPEEVAALLVILYAGTRVNEVARAKRSQLLGSVLYLEEHKTVGKILDGRSIRLPSQAVRLLEALPVCPSGFIFGEKVGTQGRKRLWDVWDRVRGKAGADGLRLQDFRRTFASAAKSSGATLDQIGELLTHTNPQTTRGYAWLFDEAAAGLSQSTADQLERLALEDKTEG